MSCNARPALTERDTDVQQAVWQQLAKQRHEARESKGGSHTFDGERRSAAVCAVRQPHMQPSEGLSDYDLTVARGHTDADVAV